MAVEEIYLGLMSGTSLDAVDAALVSFDGGVNVVATAGHTIPPELRDQLQAFVRTPDAVSLDALGRAGRELAEIYAAAVASVLTAAALPASRVAAIGCHGQTVRHQPGGSLGFTLQLGDAAALAAATGIAVVSDFRSADIALGGQGAPLAPAFHQYAFADHTADRAIVNIGGIANITVLPVTGDVMGYDTGPGNTLLDYWCNEHLGKSCDEGGRWASTGECDEVLLGRLLADEYFSRPPPKSTGREYFNARWLMHHLNRLPNRPDAADVQATLTELTAVSVANAVRAHATDSEVYVCGGGAHNTALLRRLQAQLPGRRIATTNELGIDPDWVEAVAFAWLARARLHREPGNLPAVTGARRPAVLGAVHDP